MLQGKPRQMLSRILSALFIFVLLIGCLPFAALAAGAEETYIELDGSFTGTFDLSSNKTSLFHIEDIVPGDKWTRTIRVNNTGIAAMDISVASVVSKLEDNTLFDKLVTKIAVNDEVAYDGSYGYKAADKNMTPYYLIEPGKTLDIVVTVSLPRSTGNEVMGKEMHSTWTFDARYFGSAYTVRYEDENGKELAPSKTGHAATGSTVTEKAVEIEGYIPDEESKSLLIKETDNQIVFVYSKDPSSVPETGYENIDRALTVSAWLLILSLIAVLVTYGRIRAVQREQKKWRE